MGQNLRIIAPIARWRPIIGVVRIGKKGGQESFNRARTSKTGKQITKIENARKRNRERTVLPVLRFFVIAQMAKRLSNKTSLMSGIWSIWGSFRPHNQRGVTFF